MGLCADPNSAFERCLVNTLLNLASAALQALKQLLQQELILVDAAINALMLQLLQYDVLGRAAKLLGDQIRKELDDVTQLLNGLPLGLLDKSCLEWAHLNDGINGFIQNEVRPPIEQILFEAERIASFQDELNAAKRELDAFKQLLLDVIDLLDILILEAKCRETASQQKVA